MRRILLLLAAAIALSSCSPKIYPRMVTVGFADFRPYAEEGFFLSPDPYPGDFESLGEISILIAPEIRKYYRPDIKYDVEDLTLKEILDIAVAEARNRGANGIVDMKITEESALQYKEEDGKPAHFGTRIVNFRGRRVTGLCILRKD